jgi:integrase
MTGELPRDSLARFLGGQWLPAIERTVRATTFINYRGHVENHLVPRLGTVRLSQLNGILINRAYADLLAGGTVRTRACLSPTTVRRIHATLHRALRDAVRWGLIPENPANRCDPPRARADDIPEIRTWDAHQLRRFLDIVRHDALLPLWQLLAMTGMRRGEALGVPWRDVDLHDGRIAVRQSLVASVTKYGHSPKRPAPKGCCARPFHNRGSQEPYRCSRVI